MNPAATLRVRGGWVNFARGASIVCAFDDSELDFSSRIFCLAHKNKVQVFSCRIRARFLISSGWQGAKSAGVNKM
jgi:hypothetical protein